MSQILKIDTQIEVNSSAEKVFDVFQNKVHLLPKILPDLFKDIQVLEGDWKTTGSIKQWSYCVEGNDETLKETVEALDEKNKSMTYKMLDGVFMKYYKSMWGSVQVSAKGDETSLVTWTVDYEKANEDVPAPTKYVDFLATWTKAVGAYLLNTA